MERDKEVDNQLENKNWIVLHFWDDEINKKMDDCIKAVYEAISLRIIGEN